MKTVRARLVPILFLFGFLSLQGHAAPKQASNEFPFKYREGLIWLEVRTPKSPQPLNFLLDSGAGQSVLNVRTVQRLGLKLGNLIDVQGVGSSTCGFFPERLSASVGGVRLPKQFLAVDLDKLSDACHSQVDGLLGVDFFHDRIVQIDFEGQKVRLLKPGTVVAAQEVLSLKKNANAFVAPITVNGKQNQWLRVDTGCASALQWVSNPAPGENLSHRVAIALKEISVQSIPATVLIGHTENSISAELHQEPIFENEDGLLGNGILARFGIVTIDAAARKIFFGLPAKG